MSGAKSQCALGTAGHVGVENIFDLCMVVVIRGACVRTVFRGTKARLSDAAEVETRWHIERT